MKQNKTLKFWHARQGDVLIVPVKEIPSGFTKIVGRATLALGEVTGHHHSIVDENCNGFISDTSNGLAEYIEVRNSSVDLTHQEHSVINIPTGTYKIVKQVEYTPEELRNVRD